MARQRTGSVKYNTTRKVWVARLDWADETGKKSCRKKQVINKTEGQNLVKKWIRELGDFGKEYLDAEKITFAQLAESYKTKRLIPPIYKNGRKVDGLRDWLGQQRRLKVLVEHFGKKRIRTITATDLDTFRRTMLLRPTKQKQERSLADVHRFLALLKTMFTFAVQSGWIARNPFELARGLISLSQEDIRERVLSIEEQKRLLIACRHPLRAHLFPIVLTALDSGARRGELLSLRWRHLDFEQGRMRLERQNTKTNQPRIIELSNVTLEELRHLKDSQGEVSPEELVFGIKNNFSNAWRTALSKAEITDARFHDLRATAVTTWLLRGMRSEFAMLRSGHANPGIFQRYVRMCDELRQQQRDNLNQWELAAVIQDIYDTPIDVEASQAIN